MELIDRQALIKQLKDEKIPFNADINEIINIQPVAFDAEKFVAELEERGYLISVNDGSRCIKVGEVIEIVKRMVRNE